jgi:hypothetical protein
MKSPLADRVIGLPGGQRDVLLTAESGRPGPAQRDERTGRTTMRDIGAGLYRPGGMSSCWAGSEACRRQQVNGQPGSTTQSVPWRDMTMCWAGRRKLVGGNR